MSFPVYRMEMRRHFKSFLIWSIAICGMLLLGMLFYPAISANNFIDELDVLFENPLMSGVMSAFGADVSQLGDLTGFYVTYNSIYCILLACIFASILAGNLLAKEEADRTAEFLYTKPLSRLNIYLSKAAVLFTYITLLCLFYLLTSFGGLEMVRGNAPLQLHLSEKTHALMTRQIEAHPEALYEAFALDEDSFAALSLGFASSLLEGNPEEVEEMDLSVETLEGLLDEAMLGPEDFFQQVLENPEGYMEIFSIPETEQESFLENVRNEKAEYELMKADFFRSPDLFLQFFEEDPGLVLNNYLEDPASLDKALSLLELPPDLGSRIFRPYNPGTIVTLSFYLYLLVLSIGFFVLFISLLLKRGNSVLGIALGLVFLFYFLHTLTEMASAFSPLARTLGYLSPFTWMDSNYTAESFGITSWRVLLFCGLGLGSLSAGFFVFRRKDILL